MYKIVRKLWSAQGVNKSFEKSQLQTLHHSLYEYDFSRIVTSLSMEISL
jgi:hypothetical protein